MKVMHPSDFDIHLFHEGNLYRGYQTFGAHLHDSNGQVGVNFVVWAPNAKQVSVIGDFNRWKGDDHPLTLINREGVWSGFIPGLSIGDLYKYEIQTIDGRVLHKADPYAFYSELRPNTASIVYDLNGYSWNDHKWQTVKKGIYDQPMCIYEVHLGTWKKKSSDELFSYSELAKDLIPYVKKHGFTHIELMPIIEHPFDRSWGYQGTGYFSVTSRYGTPLDFMAFIDLCHQEEIGVILDWVPGHFCKDAHGLFEFDGTSTYEYENPFVRENNVWGTANFDLGKSEVQSFLISNAIFWLDLFHIDGFRVDAVANMLYWKMHGGDEQHTNPYAVSFLQKLNQAVFSFDPHVLMIAEDSTDWALVTAPTNEGGLGFNYKWNMGWMNDVLKYMEMNPEYRKNHHHLLTFSLLYAFSENFILPFSHDEVVHGKKSLLNKMPGDYWRKFAQFRLLLGYLITHPGKKLLFMGSEFGQYDEWKDLEDLDWELLDFEMHKKAHHYSKELLSFYKSEKPLWEIDHSYEGFEWIDADNHEQSILSFIRKGKKEKDILVILCNFSEHVYQNYDIGVPFLTRYQEVFSSDALQYGGSGCTNDQIIKAEEKTAHSRPYSITVTIPPFAISIFKPQNLNLEMEDMKKYGEKEVHGNAISRRARKQVKSINK